jgi:orotidine-5'-phosphate decarboxylase
MNRQQLINSIIKRKSFLCVGLDPDEKLLPESLAKKGARGVEEFCLSIIEATAEHCVAFKPNFAFFEAFGTEGWKILDTISKHVKIKYPEHFLIADAKRGDIGNTSSRYAHAILNRMGYDSITVSPYMGEDSVKPFFMEDKWVILLLLTSNKGSEDFQKLRIADSGLPLYLQVGKTSQLWGSAENMMFVTGATHPKELSEIRSKFPEYFFLIPGVGAQGGSLEDVSEAALTNFGGILVNSSRAIIHASSGEDYLQKAAEVSFLLHQQMQKILQQRNILQ